MSDKVVIKVDHVSKTFRLPHEKTNSIKGAVVNFWHRDRAYEKQLALSDVTFEIKEGEFFGIVGRNGSGKSTLLKMLAGIYSPSKGAIEVSGKLTPFIELGVGFNQELTGRENVYLNGALLGFSRKEMSKMYKDIVNFAEIERFMDQKLKNYSSGMQVRLAFSIAIRARSDILLLDEVLAVGDAAFQQKCYDYFEELKRDKKTVVFVSHDMGAVKRFCTRAIYIETGEIKYEGNPVDIADIYQEVNMKSVIEQSEDDNKKLDDDIKISILDQDDKQHKLKFNITYKNKSKEKVFVGFSLIKDGATIAELSSLGSEDSKEKGNLEYTLDTKLFNAGLYEISAALIKFENKQPLSMTSKRAKFNITGHDLIRGGAFYLDNTFVIKNK
jgi:ABC-2 type transport system ATP-binding protein